VFIGKFELGSQLLKGNPPVRCCHHKGPTSEHVAQCLGLVVRILFPNQDFVNISSFLKVILSPKSLQSVQIGRPYYVQIGILLDAMFFSQVLGHKQVPLKHWCLSHTVVCGVTSKETVIMNSFRCPTESKLVREMRWNGITI
jgi:hypothetical protein